MVDLDNLSLPHFPSLVREAGEIPMWNFMQSQFKKYNVFLSYQEKKKKEILIWQDSEKRNLKE